MSLFRTNVVAKNPRDETRTTSAVEVLVDAGSELTWLPADLIRAAGIEPRRTRTFTTATGQPVQRSVGYAVWQWMGTRPSTRSFSEKRATSKLLEVRTLEGFGVVVDPLGHRLVAVSTIAAGGQEPKSG